MKTEAEASTWWWAFFHASLPPPVSSHFAKMLKSIFCMGRWFFILAKH